MDPITIAGLVAMLAGSAIQYKAGSDAQERQRAQVARSIDAQRALQLQAENKALDAAGKYAAPERAAEQSTIADQIAQDLIAPVSESQAIRANQQTTQGAVSGDYKNAKVVSDLNTVKAAEQLARMMGKTASSGRLRMNEGIRLMDTGQQIGTLQNFSSGRQGADNIAINQAGQVDPGMQFAGSALSSVGAAGMMGGVGKAAAGADGLVPLTAMNATTGLPAAAGYSQWLRAFAPAVGAAASARRYQ